MNTLATYLWKEWRDQRATVFGILGVQLLTCICLVVFLPDTVFGSTAMVTAISLGSIALTLVAFGPELIAGENQAGTLGFLCRMPRGLQWAFCAKVLFLLGALGCLVCTGYWLSTLFQITVEKSWGDPVPRVFYDGWVIPAAVALGLLLMSVSSWLPRSILTIPATLLLVLVLLIPCLVIWDYDPYLATYLRLQDAFDWAPPLALGVLWLSLTRGRRAGGGPRSSAWRGLTACVVVAIPLWCWVGHWMHEWKTPRPHQEIMIAASYMGADGKTAFVNTTRAYWAPWMGLVVDLETGEWHQLGRLNQGFVPVGWNESFTHVEGGGHPMLTLLPVSGIEQYGDLSYVDSSTGEVFHQVHIGAPYADVLDRARAARRSTSPLRMPDGRRVWFFRKKLEMDSEDGGFEELPWNRRDVAHTVIGYGLRISARNSKFTTYDLTRRRSFDDLSFYTGCCWVLGSRWLVAERGAKPSQMRSRAYLQDWQLLNPETGEKVPAYGMRDGDTVVTVLDDGRILVYQDDGGERAAGMLTVDLSSGTRTPLGFEGGAPGSGLYLSERFAPIRTPDGRRLFYAHIEAKRTHLTSLEPGSNRLTPPVPFASLVGCPDAATALIISPDAQRLERVDLLTGETITVFPRSETEGDR